MSDLNPPKSSLPTRTLARIAGAGILLAGLLALAFTLTARLALDQAAHGHSGQFGQQLARAAGTGLSDALARDDQSAIEQFVEKVASNSMVRRASVHGEDGRILADSGRDTALAGIEAAANDAKPDAAQPVAVNPSESSAVLPVVAQVSYDDGRGFLLLELDSRLLAADYARLRHQAEVLGLVLFGSSSVLLLFWFWRGTRRHQPSLALSSGDREDAVQSLEEDRAGTPDPQFVLPIIQEALLAPESVPARDVPLAGTWVLFLAFESSPTGDRQLSYSRRLLRSLRRAVTLYHGLVIGSRHGQLKVIFGARNSHRPAGEEGHHCALLLQKLLRHFRVPAQLCLLPGSALTDLDQYAGWTLDDCRELALTPACFSKAPAFRFARTALPGITNAHNFGIADAGEIRLADESPAVAMAYNQTLSPSLANLLQRQARHILNSHR